MVRRSMGPIDRGWCRGHHVAPRGRGRAARAECLLASARRRHESLPMRRYHRTNAADGILRDSIIARRPLRFGQATGPWVDRMPAESPTSRVDFGAIHLAVVLDAEFETDIRSRADLALAARHRAVVLRDAPEHAIAVTAALGSDPRGRPRTTPTSDLLASDPCRDGYRRFPIILSTTYPTATAPSPHSANGGELLVNHRVPDWTKAIPKTIARMLRTRRNVDNGWFCCRRIIDTP
jgi:hypothetical protein